MSDIKQKFMDILFEKDDSETVVDAPIKEVNSEEKSNEASPIKAADILYRKSGQSPFINIEEKLKTEVAKANEHEEPYQPSIQLSPIFGVIDEGGEIIPPVVNSSTDAQVKKPDDYHLDIIPSPIYGYGSKDDYVNGNYESYKSSDDKINYFDDEEVQHVFEDEQADQEISLFDGFGEE